MRKALWVLVLGLIITGCDQPKMLKQDEAVAVAQSAFADYAKSHSLDVNKYAKPQALNYDDLGVWQFFYAPTTKGQHTAISVLVVSTKRVQVTPVPDNWIKK